MPATRTHGAGDGLARCHHLGGGPHRQPARGGEARRGDHEQHDEEEEDRDDLGQHRGQARVDVARQVTDAVLGDQAEHQRTDERHGQVAQPADDRGGEAVEGEQRELGRRQTRLPDQRGDQHPGERGQHEAQGPAHLRHAVGLGPGHGHQLGVVDHGAHRHAEAEAAQEDAEHDGHDGRHHDDHDLLVLDRHSVGAEEVHRRHGAVGGGEVGRHGADDVRAAPEDGGDAEQDHQQSERHHERSFDRGSVDAPKQHELHRDGEQRRLDEDDGRDGEEEGPVPVLPELPVGEGRDHPHRALGEVEDPRRLVGHHQARGQDAVDGTRHDPEDGEGEEDAHGLTPCPPRPHRGP